MKLGSGYSTKYQLTAGVPYLIGDLLRSALLYGRDGRLHCHTSNYLYNSSVESIKTLDLFKCLFNALKFVKDERFLAKKSR